MIPGTKCAVGSLIMDGDADGIPGGAYVRTIHVALPGDTNLDGQVDVLGDAFTAIANLGTTSDAVWAQGDFNGDGSCRLPCVSMFNCCVKRQGGTEEERLN